MSFVDKPATANLTTALEKRLRSILTTAIRTEGLSGANLLLLRHGRPVVRLEEGIARQDGTPFAPDTILRLFSMTKPITAAAAMILVERGLLDLDTPVADILPEYADLRVCPAVRAQSTIVSRLPGEAGAAQAGGKATAGAANTDSAADVSRETSGDDDLSGDRRTFGDHITTPLTVRHLLTMTSGLSYPVDDNPSGRGSARLYAQVSDSLGTDHEMTTREFARRLAAVPLRFQPGTHWQYGTSADVLGAVIEQVSGERLGAFLSENLFGPLGMTDTAFWVPVGKRGRLADLHRNPAEPDFPVDAEDHGFVRTNYLGITYTADHEPAFQSGGAGLFSTLDDYSRFALMLLGHGHLGDTRILSPATVDYMTHDTLTPVEHTDFEDWQSGCGYNCLMRIVRDPSRTNHLAFPSDYGWDGWSGTYFTNMPSHDAILLLGVQQVCTGTNGLTRRLRNAVSAYLGETE